MTRSETAQVGAVDPRETERQDESEDRPDVCFEMRRSTRVEQEIQMGNSGPRELFAIDLRWEKIGKDENCTKWESDEDENESEDDDNG